MKIRIVVVLLCFLTAAFGQDILRKLYVNEGNPNSVVTGLSGDLCTEKSSSALWIKAGGSGTTGWIQLTNSNGNVNAILSGSGTQVSGSASMLITATSVRVFLTGSTGIEMKSGTTTTF